MRRGRYASSWVTGAYPVDSPQSSGYPGSATYLFRGLTQRKGALMSLSPHPRNGITREQWKAIGDSWLKPLSGAAITRGRIIIGIIAALLVMGALVAANWVTTDYGFIPVGFGLEATAGTLFAGIMLASRDAVQDALGRWAVLVIILLGTVVSLAISAPQIALAAALAFGFAELCDFAVYTPIRSKAKFGDRRWAVAVVGSNIVGAVADTLIFLGVAFGPAAIMPALPGQLVGKLWATVAYLILGWLFARLVLSKVMPSAEVKAPRNAVAT